MESTFNPTEADKVTVLSQKKKKHDLDLLLFTVCGSLLSGHAAPSASFGGEAAGDKATDATTQEGNKSMLVMSGGEGYIDFRMGELSTCNRWNITAEDLEANAICLYVSR